MRRKIAAGNWKLNGNRASASELLAALQIPANEDVEVLVCPPMVYLAELAETFAGRGIAFGAQDVAQLRRFGQDVWRQAVHQIDRKCLLRMAAQRLAQGAPGLCAMVKRLPRQPCEKWTVGHWQFAQQKMLALAERVP